MLRNKYRMYIVYVFLFFTTFTRDINNVFSLCVLVSCKGQNIYTYITFSFYHLFICIASLA